MYKVYVLHAPTYDKIYIGQTSNLEKRMLSHNEFGKGYTSRFRPWELIYEEDQETRSAAMRRERALKSSRGRHWIRTELLE